MDSNKRIKIAGDATLKQLKIIDGACEIEHRSRGNLMIKASLDYAKKILLEGKNGN